MARWRVGGVLRPALEVCSHARRRWTKPNVGSHHVQRARLCRPKTTGAFVTRSRRATTHAAALTFTVGCDSEARAIYLAHRDAKNVIDNDPWEKVVLQQIADVRQHDLTSPLFGDREKLFARLTIP